MDSFYLQFMNPTSMILASPIHNDRHHSYPELKENSENSENSEILSKTAPSLTHAIHRSLDRKKES
jgi:hypothetical protein